jgi:hypothetical protein
MKTITIINSLKIIETLLALPRYDHDFDLIIEKIEENKIILLENASNSPRNLIYITEVDFNYVIENIDNFQKNYYEVISYFQIYNNFLSLLED